LSADQSPQTFWQTKSLDQMTNDEWESLCDGCGKCCLLKVEYEDTGEIQSTSVACKLLDLESCQCSNYPRRRAYVPDCIDLKTVPNLLALAWLPQTCAYRLIANGEDLADWHPLVSGSPDTVHEAGISVRFKVISEDGLTDIDEELPGYVVDWRL